MTKDVLKWVNALMQEIHVDLHRSYPFDMVHGSIIISILGLLAWLGWHRSAFALSMPWVWVVYILVGNVVMHVVWVWMRHRARGSFLVLIRKVLGDRTFKNWSEVNEDIVHVAHRWNEVSKAQIVRLGLVDPDTMESMTQVRIGKEKS